MDSSHMYILLMVIGLILIAWFFYRDSADRKREGLSQLAAISFVLILAGLFFIDHRAMGYMLIGSGVILAIIDIVRKLKRKDDQ